MTSEILPCKNLITSFQHRLLRTRHRQDDRTPRNLDIQDKRKQEPGSLRSNHPLGIGLKVLHSLEAPEPEKIKISQ